MERPRGAWIDKVYPTSPAGKAGIRPGDVVLRFGGVDVADLNHLINIVSMAAVGEPAEVVVWRERREVKLKVTVGDRDRTLRTNPGAPSEAELDPSGLVRRPNRSQPRLELRPGARASPHSAHRSPSVSSSLKAGAVPWS